ncbi:MAG: DNA (cytosine-5-)-methyltransferase [Bacteroides sp.]|nr:DNA (cytosine-5-)-methyltransferase [Bacteroides sp.]
MQKHKFPYNWRLSEAKFTKDKGKVFSLFACGGGSTMGYKLAGFDVIGCNEIDPKINQVYVANHSPKYNLLGDIKDLKYRELPVELYNLDILDGSPPCSTFSIAGNREKDWGKEKKFREGQSKQVLDTLFFDFIDLAKELQPKIVIAENVKGLLMGNAIDYVRRIYKDFEDAGYYCQHFLLDASKMGVPQIRNRVFFICIRHDLGMNFLKVSDLFNVEPHISMDFNEPKICYGEFADYMGKPYGKRMKEMFDNRKEGDIDMAAAYLRLTGKRGFFNQNYLYEDKVCNTLTAHVDSTIPFKKPIYLSTSEVCNISTFPQDYNFCGLTPYYICGMSVPPIMMAQVATRVYNQWLSKL